MNTSRELGQDAFHLDRELPRRVSSLRHQRSAHWALLEPVAAASDNDTCATNEGQDFMDLCDRVQLAFHASVDPEGIEYEDAREGEERVDVIGCDIGELRAEHGDADVVVMRSEDGMLVRQRGLG